MRIILGAKLLHMPGTDFMNLTKRATLNFQWLLLMFLLTISSGAIKGQEQSIELIPALRGTELPEIDINSIAQDSAGFLWIGTWKGLYRYDGREVINYSLHMNNKIGRKISSLFLDSDGMLWIGTYSEGLFIYNTYNQHITEFKEINGTKLSNIIRISEASGKRIMVASYDGIFIYNIKEEKFETATLSHTAKAGSIRLTLGYEDVNGNFWAGSDQGILKLEKGKSRLIHTGFHPNIYIHKITELANGWLLVSSLKGNDIFEVINGELRPLKDLPLANSLKQFQRESNTAATLRSAPGQLWIGTHNGLNIFDIKSGHHISSPAFKGMSESDVPHIESIFEDRQGIVWVGTSRGLYKYDRSRKPFHMMSVGKNSSEIMALTRHDKNAIWAGTRGQGIILLNLDSDGKTTSQKLLTFENENINSLIKEDIFSLESGLDGDLWISTKGRGIVHVNNFATQGQTILARNAVLHNEENGSPDNHVMCIYRDSRGIVWGGSWSNGLIYYSPEKQRFARIKGELANELKKYPIVKIVETGPNKYYLGTRGNGLLRIELNNSNDSLIRIERFINIVSDSTSIGNNFISDLVIMPGNDLWIATEFGLSVLRNNAKKFINFGTKREFPSPVIQSLNPVSANELWLSSENGLGKILTENGLPQLVRSYNKSDGLDISFFNTSCVIQAENGHVYFGGKEGICHFNPVQITDSRSMPNALVTQMKLFNQIVTSGLEYDGRTLLDKAIWVTETVKLKYYQNTLSFSFSGMDFSVPEKILYAYKLEGLDKNWTYTHWPECHYPRLRHGKYTLLVRCSNSDGIWSDHTTQLEILLMPPWWYSKLAYLIYTLIAISLIYLGYRLILYRHQLRIEKLEKDQEIELSEMRMRFYTNISHEFRTPLTIIMGLTGRLRVNDDPEKRADFYEKIDRNARILLRLITDLMDLRKVEKEDIRLRKEILNPSRFFVQTCENFAYLFPTKGIEFSITDKVPEGYKISADSNRLESAVYNLLSNAFKFTPEGGKVNCSVELIQKAERKNGESFWKKIRTTHTTYLAFIVSDTGIGMTRSQLRTIFDKYNKNRHYDNSETNQSSYGIGLVFTRSLIELHGGTIEVESDKGKGSTFTVYLPLNDGTVVSDADENLVIAEKKLITGNLPGEKPIVKTDETTGDEKIILVIDDNPEVRDLLKEVLTPAYRIVEAVDGNDGWNKACEILPDLVISDVIMPGMDGNTLCEKLKTSTMTNHIPVILLTALPTNEDRIKGLKHGADSYIPKPFELEHLVVRIQKLISSRILLKDKYMKDFLLRPERNTDNEANPSIVYVGRIKKLIEQNIINSEYDVSDLCRDLATSRMQLYRKLKATVGYSANELIRKVRLYKAAELLLRGDLNIAQVTYEVGFSDLQYFRKCFKEEFEMTPSQYIKANVKDGDLRADKVDPFDQENLSE